MDAVKFKAGDKIGIKKSANLPSYRGKIFTVKEFIFVYGGCHYPNGVILTTNNDAFDSVYFELIKSRQNHPLTNIFK